jgi:hypothetical protein
MKKKLFSAGLIITILSITSFSYSANISQTNTVDTKKSGPCYAIVRVAGSYMTMDPVEIENLVEGQTVEFKLVRFDNCEDREKGLIKNAKECKPAKDNVNAELKNKYGGTFAVLSSKNNYDVVFVVPTESATEITIRNKEDDELRKKSEKERKENDELAAYYEEQINNASSEDRGETAYKLLAEIHAKGQFDRLEYYPILKQLKSAFITSKKASFEALETIFGPLNYIKGFKDKNFILFFDGYQSYIIRKLQNGIKYYTASRAGFGIVGTLGSPVNAIILATNDPMGGSGDRPGLKVVCLKGDEFMDVAVPGKSSFYEISIQNIDGENVIVGLATEYLGAWPNAEEESNFPVIYSWDGKALKDTTYEHKKYLVDYYKQKIEYMKGAHIAVSKAMKDSQRKAIKLSNNRAEFINKIDDLIKNSDEGEKFWNENLKSFREDYDKWNSTNAKNNE